MAGLFGTDGIRGKAGYHPISPEILYAAARTFAELRTGSEILVGMDTRESSSDIAGWICTGLTDGGCTPRFCDVLPTPVLAYGIRHLPVSGGIMITASHNPYMDNGVKFFDSMGVKISDQEEATLTEAVGHRLYTPNAFLKPRTGDIQATLMRRYANDLLENLEWQDVPMILVPLDCANGAAIPLIQHFRQRLGFALEAHNTTPDGRNINLNCGAAQPEHLAAGMAALDGDGDRILLKDGFGRLLSGDHILLFLCQTLQLNGIVGTVMTNQSVSAYCDRNGLTFERTDVGDRHVRHAMDRLGVLLGGETSGHIIFDRLNHTGDGFAVYLQMMQLIFREQISLADVFDRFPMMPQRLVNVPVDRRIPLDQFDGLTEFLDDIRFTLADAEGRIFPRYSGTENLLRFLIESLDDDRNRDVATSIERFFQTRRS